MKSIDSDQFGFRLRNGFVLGLCAWLCLGLAVAQAQLFGPAASNPTVLLRENCGTPGSTLQPAGTSGGNNAVDPGELVEIKFAFTNHTGKATDSLSVFLTEGNGVLSPGNPQFIVGPIADGGRIEATLQFVASGIAGETIAPAVAIQRGAESLGTVTFSVPLGKKVVLNDTFSNPSPITINSVGPASPYPSTLTVPSTFTGKVTGVRVHLIGLGHQNPADIQLLLVSPTGEKVALLSGAGGDADASGLDITFDDAAATSISQSGPLTSGTFKPSSLFNSFPLPVSAPSPPYGTELANFNGKDPRGEWQLYVADLSAQDGGQITGGWELFLSTQELQSCVSLTSPTLNGYPTAPQSISEDSSISIGLGITDDTTPLENLIITAHSSRQDLLPDTNIVFSPASGGLFMTLTPLTNAFGVGPGIGADITTRVTDRDGLFTEKTFRLDVQPVNDLPFITTITNIALSVNKPSNPVEFTIGDVETPADKLILVAASSQPDVIPNSGVVVTGSGANRSVTVTPAVNKTGFSTVTLSVLDENGGTVSVNFLVVVSVPNTLPQISDINPKTILPDTTNVIDFLVSDLETPADELTVTGTSSNTNVIPDSHLIFGGTGTNRQLTFIAPPGSSGSTVILILVKDANGGLTGDSFVVSVNPNPPKPNVPPAISGITNQTTSEGAPIEIPFTVSDIDGDLSKLVVTASADLTSLLPATAFQFIGTNTDRILRVTPSPNRSGNANVVVVATDDRGATAITSFQLRVKSLNAPPEITPIANTSITENTTSEALTFNVADQETSFDNLVLAAHSSDQTLIPDANIHFGGTGFERSVTVTPAAQQTGTATITVTVTDDGGASSARSFQITVTPTPPPVPQLSVTLDQSVVVISWPDIDNSLGLQQTLSLSAPFWTSVLEQSHVVGGRREVRLIPSGTVFFRLRR